MRREGKGRRDGRGVSEGGDKESSGRCNDDILRNST